MQRLPITDSRFPIPDSRFPIPDSRFPIPCSLQKITGKDENERKSEDK
ncbi:hypothetical protein [Moorena sp. SIO4G3]|nr:hypothetical protein [Moorena sp. SIO4G3]NEO74797.1 hypothetical protein [Moorena sp. SIO4G3]